MSKDAFCYTFRFCCDPGFNDKAESESLLRFIEEAAIDDVAVFANVEELNTGHMDEAEQLIFLDLMRELQPKLAKLDVTLSVNHWHSIMHADLGKQLRKDQHFRRMVDVDGQEAALCVCPMDETWQQYMADMYARYAVLHPEIVWIEDDFRYHNHEPLHWGGCFCEEHMKLYNERLNETFSREEFVREVLKSGAPTKSRYIWLEACNEVLCKAAAGIEKAVHQVSPATRVGLMSSAPHIHAAEGRRWHQLLTSFAGENRMVDRIHLPGYTEGAAWNYLQNFNMVSMYCRALLPKDTLVYPELENYPYSRFAKSCRFTRFQLLSGLPLNMAGITIDLFDLNGNGIVFEEGYQHILQKTKPYLNKMSSLEVFCKEKKGVCVMVNETASYFLHTKKGKDMEELYPQEVFFAGLLPAMGIPVKYCTDSNIQGEVAAVCGQYFRSMKKEQIQQLFENNFIIMNADATETLLELGLGHLAGIESCTWHRQNMGDYAYEQVVNQREYCGIRTARASAVISCSDVIEVKYMNTENVDTYTAFYDSYRRFAFSGQVVVNDRALIYPFGNFNHSLDIPQMLLNSVRQAILQEIISKVRIDFPMVEKSPYLEPYCTVSEGKLYLYLVNGASDDVTGIRLKTGKMNFQKVTVHPSDNDEFTLECRIEDEVCVLPFDIPALETALLTFTE